MEDIIDSIYEENGLEKALEIDAKVSENMRKIDEVKEEFKKHLYLCIYEMIGEEKEITRNIYVKEGEIVEGENSTKPVSMDALIGGDFYKYSTQKCRSIHKEKMENVISVLKENTDLIDFLYSNWYNSIRLICAKEDSTTKLQNNYIVYKAAKDKRYTGVIKLEKFVSSSSKEIEEKYKQTDRKKHYTISEKESRKYDVKHVEEVTEMSEDILHLVKTAENRTEFIIYRLEKMKEEIEELTKEIMVARKI